MEPLSRPSRAAVIELLSELVAIDSVNPSLVPGAAGEARIARFVAGWLAERGLEVDTPEVAPGRPNAIGRLRRSGGRSIILNAHMDTVGVAGMDAPFEPRVAGDRLYGRGAYDMKGGLAAVMLAAEMVAQSGAAGGDVIVAAVADEEYASLGTASVVEFVRADAAIVTEPTGLRLCVAHKGFAWLLIHTQGRAAHGSKPDRGIDAIAHMGRVLVGIERLGSELLARTPHPLLGTGSIHASLIEGGQELSSYPDRCVLQVERRTVPGEMREDIEEEIRSLLDGLTASDPTFAADSSLFFWREPFEVSRQERIVQTVETVIAQVCGQPPSVYGDTPWMDAALLSAAGIPTVVFGPGGEGAHAVTEWVSLEEVAICAEVLARTVIALG